MIDMESTQSGKTSVCFHLRDTLHFVLGKMSALKRVYSCQGFNLVGFSLFCLRSISVNQT